MKQEIDNNAMWAAFRQELALQGELQVVAAIDNALNNLGFTIKETSTIVPIPLKQCEKKPTDNEMIEILRAEYEKGKADAIEEMQNSTWSEDDETMLKRVVDFIPQCMTAHGYNEYINWLKSLKDRVQPKQEWSEDTQQ